MSRKHCVKSTLGQNTFDRCVLDRESDCLLSSLAVMLAGDLALFEHDRRTEKDSNESKGGERNECNHKDGHGSLLSFNSEAMRPRQR
jgi:hypothetical protein